MPYQFLAHKNKFFDPCQRGRRVWTTPTGIDWTALLYFNLPHPDLPFVGYVPQEYPGGYPPYTKAQYLASLGGLMPLPPLPMYLDEFQKLLSEGQKYLGNSYLWGGKIPPFFDCSGFVGWCYKSTELLSSDVVSYTGTLWQACTKTDDPYYGDMVFWKGSNGTPDDANAHVEIFLGWKDKEQGTYWTIGSAGGGVKYRTQTMSLKSFYGFFRIPPR